MKPTSTSEFRINRRIAVRAQADYLLTRFLGLNQNNLQTSIGLVYRFGHKQKSFGPI